MICLMMAVLLADWQVAMSDLAKCVGNLTEEEGDLEGSLAQCEIARGRSEGARQAFLAHRAEHGC
jgi:hypothetical protein